MKIANFFIYTFAFLILLASTAFLFAPSTVAQDYAVCDLCGFCPPSTPNPPAPTLTYSPPSHWKDCVKCLYPNIPNINNLDTALAQKETLAISPTIYNPPSPYPGRLYSMIGCIKTDLSSFSDPSGGAAAHVVQRLLDLLFTVVGAIALLYLIYGAYLVLTSQADPERLNHGRRTIYAAIVGLAFSLLSIFIVRLLATGVLRIPGFG